MGQFVHFLELGPREETLAEGLRTATFILGINLTLLKEESIYISRQIQEHLTLLLSSQYLSGLHTDL